MRPLLFTLALAPAVGLAAPPDPESLDAAMAKAQREAMVCLSDAAGTDSSGGELVVHALVDPQGALVQPEVARTSIADAEVIACALSAVGRQRVPRDQGGGYAPIRRTLVLWDPPAGAKAVKVPRAQRLLGDALPGLSACLDALPDTPDRLQVDFLVGDRRVHPLSAGLPTEQARCVAQALAGGRLTGVGAVRAQLGRGPDGDWRVDHIGTLSEDHSEQRSIDYSQGANPRV